MIIWKTGGYGIDYNRHLLRNPVAMSGVSKNGVCCIYYNMDTCTLYTR